jgi:hypothetical protein
MNEKRFFPKANCSLVSNNRDAVAAKRHLFRVPFQEKKPLFAENNGHFESTTHNIQHLSRRSTHTLLGASGKITRSPAAWEAFILFGASAEARFMASAEAESL